MCRVMSHSKVIALTIRHSPSKVTLHTGDALLLPEMYWHAVENLDATIAVGLNDMGECTGARFNALQQL